MTVVPPLLGSPLDDTVEVVCNPLAEIIKLSDPLRPLSFNPQLLDEQLRKSYRSITLPLHKELSFEASENFYRFTGNPLLEIDIGQTVRTYSSDEDPKINKKEELELLEKLPKIFHDDHIDFLIGSQVLRKIDHMWYYHGFLCLKSAFYSTPH